MVGFTGKTILGGFGTGLLASICRLARSGRRGAARFGQEVDDGALLIVLRRRRDDPETHEHQQQSRVDRQREREAGHAPLQRRPVVGRVEAVGWQGWAEDLRRVRYQ